MKLRRMLPVLSGFLVAGLLAAALVPLLWLPGTTRPITSRSSGSSAPPT